MQEPIFFISSKGRNYLAKIHSLDSDGKEEIIVFDAGLTNMKANEREKENILKELKEKKQDQRLFSKSLNKNTNGTSFNAKPDFVTFAVSRIRTKSPKTRIIGNNLARSKFVSGNLKNLDDISVKIYLTFQYTIKMSVGYPENDYTFIVDTGSTTTLLIDDECQDSACNTHKKYVPYLQTAKTYDINESIKYGLGYVEYELKSDSFFYNEFEIPSQMFGSVTRQQEVFDGVIFLLNFFSQNMMDFSVLLIQP